MIIVGLGNPGSEYGETRHNIGFQVVESFSEKFSIPLRDKKLGQCSNIVWGKGKVGEQEVILLLPQTFMNNSGEAVRSVLEYFRLTGENLLVVHDDLDLPLGSFRFDLKASAAGHRGVQSVIDHLGSPDFYRFRFGIGRPTVREEDIVSYVLSSFGAEEKKKLPALKKEAVQAIEMFLSEGSLPKGLEKVQQKYHHKGV
ncbi:MAG: aminoacyl-tRNA hydrolase [Deltaproteobacteria bacterium]|nr:aminoacyl-tRNA hydrolase [Deltaproteobacteria bacterium]